MARLLRAPMANEQYAVSSGKTYVSDSAGYIHDVHLADEIELLLKACKQVRLTATGPETIDVFPIARTQFVQPPVEADLPAMEEEHVTVLADDPKAGDVSGSGLSAPVDDKPLASGDKPPAASEDKKSDGATDGAPPQAPAKAVITGEVGTADAPKT